MSDFPEATTSESTPAGSAPTESRPTIPPEKITQAGEIIGRIKSEVGKAVVGQEAVIEQVLIALIASGHVLLEGVPGLGKTLLVRALAKTMQGSFARIQFTPDLMPSDVTGHSMFDAATNSFSVRKGPVFANLLLADEINRAPAKTQSALLEVMQEYQVTIEGEAHPMPLPFLTLATQNPVELEGTYPLPEAQLDRFLLKVEVAYPSVEDEAALVRRVTEGQIGDALRLDGVSAVVKPETVLALQRLAAMLTVDARIHDYAVRIVRATRTWPGVAIGAGPRGSIGLVRAARARALMAARDFVTPDDVKRVALPALRHRVSLAPDAQLEGQSTDGVLTAIVDSIEAPRT
ncbi:MAG: MoxR family ATPase [Betaproteobacteria bacterium]|nr:MoxR family ATPase [Betaproteobacteria bacterium]